jgi:hypothetical protein
MEGYDISHHQEETPDLSGVDFVIVRACYGATPDEMYLVHAEAVRDAGKVLGAYMFLRPVEESGESVEDQVNTFLLASADADFWAIDREKDGDDPQMKAADVRKTISLIQAHGRRVGLYASDSMFRDFGQNWNWVARWSTNEPETPWDIWQWEGGGDDKLDNDRFVGTIGGLLALGAPLQATVDGLKYQLDMATDAIERQQQRIELLQQSVDEYGAEMTRISQILADTPEVKAYLVATE